MSSCAACVILPDGHFVCCVSKVPDIYCFSDGHTEPQRAMGTFDCRSCKRELRLNKYQKAYINILRGINWF
jgi:hypothetical protein